MWGEKMSGLRKKPKKRLYSLKVQTDASARQEGIKTGKNNDRLG